MRLSRSSRKRRNHRFPLPQIVVIVVISAYGMGQVATPTFAILTNQAAADSAVTSAFVFPGTVDQIASQASNAMGRAAQLLSSGREALAGILDKNTDSETGNSRIAGINEAAEQACREAAAAGALTSELRGYLERSQYELEQQLNEISQRLSPYGITLDQLTALQNVDQPAFEQLLGQAFLTSVEFQEMVKKLNGIRRVDTYVRMAYQQAETAASQAASYADEAAQLPGQAAAAVQERRLAEEKAKLEAEKKAKLEAEKKAKLEAEEKAKLEAEEKAKLEAKEKAKLEAEEKAKLEAEEKAKLEAEEKAKLEAEEKAKLEAEEKAKLEAEEKAKLEAEEKAKLEAEKKAKLEAEEKAKLEAEKKAKPEEGEQPGAGDEKNPIVPSPGTKPDAITLKIGDLHELI